jgi:hypothetical protein
MGCAVWVVGVGGGPSLQICLHRPSTVNPPLAPVLEEKLH